MIQKAAEVSVDVLNSPAATAALNSPFVGVIIFIAVVVIAAITVGGPILGLYREWRKIQADAAECGSCGAKAGAETALYEQLRGQIEANSRAIQELQSEKADLQDESRKLRAEVDRLKAFEQQIVSMRARLAEKDRIIEERDREIRDLTKVILKMKDQIHALEMRLQMKELTGDGTAA